MVLIFFIGIILDGICITLIEFLILDRLSPNYIIIGYELGKIPIILLHDNNMHRWIISIITIIQVFFLCFYLEIFEYNFFSLNRNTKRNIIRRERSESREIKNNEKLLKDDEDYPEYMEIE